MEGDQCPVGKIIEKCVHDRQKKCLRELASNGNGNLFREKVLNALAELYRAYKIYPFIHGVDIKYEDPFIQFAYMYRYLMFSVRSLSKVMHDSNVFKKRAKRACASIRVACLGGGPGTDVLGVLDYFMKYMADFRGQLDIRLYDREGKWRTCWKSMKKAITAELHNSSLRVTVNFHDFDVIKDHIQNADVITMHYLMEEVYSQRENPDVKECFDHILQTAKPGALFLYSGMYMYQVIHWVHELFLKNNCELLTPDTKQPEQRQRIYLHKDVTSTNWVKWVPCPKVDLRDEKDLKLFDCIGEVSQRYKGEVVYRLYRKNKK